MITGRWDSDTIKKIMRLFIGVGCFLCFTTIIGLHLRAAHQLIFCLFVIILSALLMKNIWATLFIWWACLLFAISKFECGQIYITNIFYGAMFYYITKVAFERRHIDFFIKIVLWVLCLNLFYGCLQILSYDFVFNSWENLNVLGVQVIKGSPNGFMGNSGVMASFCCMCIPLVATRSKYSVWLSLLLLIPVFILRSTSAIGGSFVVLMFIAWFSMNKKIWFLLLAGMIIALVVFLIFFDLPGMERINVWKASLNDINQHPVVGWGMDSFRKYTATKPFTYVQGPSDIPLSKWDNPHNLIISLLFEFGIISVILLGGYLRHIFVLFRASGKNGNSLALTGFLIAFLMVSLGNFPIFLARMAVIIIPALALLEVELG